MRAQWENEKKSITELKGVKEQIEEVKHQMEEAERNYDLEKLATLKYGTLPELERKLEEEKVKIEAAKENQLLKEEVTEEEKAIVNEPLPVPAPEPVVSEEVLLLKEIRDLLKENK